MHTPLKNALREFAGEEKQLLSLIATVIRAAEKSSFISDLLESGELFSPLKLTVEEAHTVLKEITLYEEAGIMCRVPDWWRKNTNSLRLAITVGEESPSRLGLDAILDFFLSVKVGDVTLSEDELAGFLDMAEGLIKYKGKWVEISKDKLNTLLSAFDKVKGLAEKGDLSIGEAMRLELNGNKLLDIPEEEVEISITNGEWLKTVKKDLTHPLSPPKIRITPSFKGLLRPYQEKGYQWLHQMSKFKFGACLADDMGLGKTVQIIAYLEHARTHSGGKALLILPASLKRNCRTLKELSARDLFSPPS